MNAISRRRRLRPGQVRPRRTVVPPFSVVHNQRWKAAVAQQALDQLAVGVIVTDNSGRVIEMSRAAESILQLEDGLMIRNDQLCARRAFETAKVSKLITDATEDGHTTSVAGRVRIGRRDGLLAYVLTVVPLRADRAIAESW